MTTSLDCNSQTRWQAAAILQTNRAARQCMARSVWSAPPRGALVCIAGSGEGENRKRRGAAHSKRFARFGNNFFLLMAAALLPLPSQAAMPLRSATQPMPRGDANSRLAHEQLVRKAKQGGIDVYFLGDSITRRWGATDPHYRTLLENWRTNFFGWNAANFGWGADRIENILWRAENGELDGVNPKVIVLLAGINNVGAQPCDDAKVADITDGLKQLVDVCLSKATNATVVLMGIFPRNDNLAVMPSIDHINANLARLADGHRVRLLNINDKLADPDGKLLPGMMISDQLHPTAKAYQVWADALKPILTELLGPPAKTDHAPPATGDPSAKP